MERCIRHIVKKRKRNVRAAQKARELKKEAEEHLTAQIRTLEKENAELIAKERALLETLRRHGVEV